MTVKKGMIVYLKSGSPAMTVTSLVRPNTWLCKWFTGDKLNTGHFNESELTDKKPN